jgi:uncharacterized membrane protein HdeD (DUF308 family)
MAQSIPTPKNVDVAKLQSALKQELHDHWKLFLFEGVLLLVLGGAALVIPAFASVAVTVFIGWLFLVGGIVGFIASLSARALRGFWWALLSSALAIVMGIVLLWMPLEGVLTLTLALGIYYIADGVTAIMLAIQHRKDKSGAWGWLAASGIVDLILAGIIIAGWPGTAVWVIGLLVGIDMMFAGWALMMVALRSRKATA